MITATLLKTDHGLEVEQKWTKGGLEMDWSCNGSGFEMDQWIGVTLDQIWNQTEISGLKMYWRWSGVGLDMNWIFTGIRLELNSMWNAGL